MTNTEKALKVMEAVKDIASISPEQEISLSVDHFSEKAPFSKTVTKKTVINITLIETL